ncbi:hypothetical protein GGI35DRAFT_250432 [Trichoderma velutinum]
MSFINISHPAEASLAQHRSRAQAHIARHNHAKSRRLRIAQYQGLLMDPNGPSSFGLGQERLTGQTFPKPHAVASGTDAEAEVRAITIANPVNPLSSDRRDPFDTFSHLLTPIEHFLFDHYVKVIIPYQNLYCAIYRDSTNFQQLINTEWVQLALADKSLLSVFLLATCRHLALFYTREGYVIRALQYKQECLQALKDKISEGAAGVSDATFATVITLAFEELMEGNLATYRHHLQGVLQMVQLRQRPQSLGLDAFFNHLLGKLLESKALLDISQHNQPTMY